MSMIRLELSNRDYNTIAEACWKAPGLGATPRTSLGVCTSFAPDRGRLRANGRLDRNSTAIGVSPGAGGPYWSACGNRRRQHHADGAGL